MDAISPEKWFATLLAAFWSVNSFPGADKESGKPFAMTHDTAVLHPELAERPEGFFFLRPQDSGNNQDTTCGDRTADLRRCLDENAAV
jgi:hypothetical protein